MSAADCRGYSLTDNSLNHPISAHVVMFKFIRNLAFHLSNRDPGGFFLVATGPVSGQFFFLAGDQRHGITSISASANILSYPILK